MNKLAITVLLMKVFLIEKTSAAMTDEDFAQLMQWFLIYVTFQPPVKYVHIPEQKGTKRNISDSPGIRINADIPITPSPTVEKTDNNAAPVQLDDSDAGLISETGSTGDGGYYPYQEDTVNADESSYPGEASYTTGDSAYETNVGDSINAGDVRTTEYSEFGTVNDASLGEQYYTSFDYSQ